MQVIAPFHIEYGWITLVFGYNVFNNQKISRFAESGAHMRLFIFQSEIVLKSNGGLQVRIISKQGDLL